MEELDLNVEQFLSWFPHEQDEPYVLIRVDEDHVEELIHALTVPLRRCYVADSVLALRAIQHSTSERVVLAAKLPSPGSTMSGDFGEILTYCLQAAELQPLVAIGPKKWRLKQDRTKPAPYSDVVQFVLPTWPTPSDADVILCAEVKAKATTGQFSPIENAIKDSAKDRTSRLAKTLVWLRERATGDEPGELDTAQINRFIDSTDYPRHTKRFRAVAIICSNLVNAEIAKPLQGGLTTVSLVVVALPNLQEVYSSVYTAAADSVPSTVSQPQA